MQVRQKYRPRKKKPEYVQGAWAYILITVMFVFGCGITGVNPSDVASLGFLLPIVAGFAVIFVLLVGLVGGILGCGKGK